MELAPHRFQSQDSLGFLQRCPLPAAIAACLIAGSLSASAQVIKQNTTTMNTASDWSAAPTISVDGQIGGVISAVNLAALTLGGDVSLRGILFGDGMLGPMTVDSSTGFTLTLGTTGLNMSGSASTNNSTFDVTINAAIAGATSPIAVKSGRTITLGGGATSLGGLSGLGTVNLTSATSKNYTFENDRNLNAGSFSSPTTTGLQIGNNSVVSVLGLGAADIGDGGNGVVRVNGTGASLTMGGGSADAAVGRATGLGLLQIDNGSVSVGRDLRVGLQLTNSGARGSLIVNGGTLAVTNLLNINTSTTTSSITPQSVVEINGGQVSASRIRLNNGSSAGHAQLTMTGGTLYLSNNGDAIDAPGTGTSTYNITLSGGTIGSSTTAASGGWTSAANMTLGTTNGDITFQSANATAAARNLTLSGVLSGAGGLVKTGAGNLTLSGANSYTGNTTVNSGTLAVGNVNALQNSTLDTGASGSQQVTFTVAGNNTYNLGGLAGADGLAIGNNSISVGSNNATTVYSGSITGTGGGLAKVGLGTLSLNASNTYSGNTSVSAGTLRLAATNSLGNTSAVTIASGATLEILSSGSVNNSAAVTLNGSIVRGAGVSETFGALTLGSNATINFGTGAVGTLAFGDYTPSFRLNVTNFLVGNVLTFTSNLTSSIANPSFFTFDNAFTSSWSGGTFTITAIPEPSTMLAGILAICLLVWSQRKSILSFLKQMTNL